LKPRCNLAATFLPTTFPNPRLRFIMRHFSPTLLALSLLSGSLGTGVFMPHPALAQDAAPPDAAAPVAPAGAITIKSPFNKATVRESVLVKLREFPKGGYVSISIDDRFIKAQALPKSAGLPVFIWDTKAPYMTTEDPNTALFYKDGPHAITLAVYDDSGKLVGRDSVSVQVANKINLPSAQGIKLVYPWKTGLSLLYQRRTTLDAAPPDAPTQSQTVQEAVLRFSRTVENTTGGTYLIRDEMVTKGKGVGGKPFAATVTNRNFSSALTAQRARYREVDARGRTLSELESQNGAGSLGFSLPVLPPRRVSVGARWQTPVKLALDWTGAAPATVTATSTLEDFEWQDRYPTAKIHETYSGSVVFPAGPGLSLPPMVATDVKFDRVIYFAYNAGRVVRTETTMTLTSTAPGLLVAPTASPGGYPGSPGSGSDYPGGTPGGFPGGRPQFGGSPGGSPSGSPSFPGGSPSFPGGSPACPGGSPAFPGGSPAFPGGGRPSFPGGSPGGYPGSSGGYGGTGAGAAPTKLTFQETVVIII